jgi:transcriptional regulator with PAS, ATPase and Fis domain
MTGYLQEAAMDIPNWMDGIDVAVTLCDREGIIVYMNDKSALTFAEGGGRVLLGTNLMACHPEAARQKIRRLLETGASNSYTIEKNGVKKLIYQTPWHADGQPAGLVEFSLVIPFSPPHFVRG